MELKDKLGTGFSSRLSIIERDVEDIWKKGELHHHYYTLHGLDHSKNVIVGLEKLVEGLNPNYELCETEVFYLLAAAFLHDVGMQCIYEDDEARAKKISEDDNITYTVADLIRDEHEIRSGKFILDKRESLKLNHIESNCIKLISEGHRKTNLQSTQYEDILVGTERIRIRLLAALLRLADELEISFKRAPENLFDLLKKNMPTYSQLQWFKHHYTSGVLIETNEQHKMRKTEIQIHFQYPNEAIGEKLTPIILKPIEEKIKNLHNIFSPYGLSLDLKPPSVTINSSLKSIPETIYLKHINQNLSISMEIPQAKGFLGREEELDEFIGSLDKNIIIIEGIAGIGKTYIASQFAEILKEQYVVYWYGSLNETTTLSSVLNKISIFLDENGRPKLLNSIKNFGYDVDVLISILKDELKENKFVLFFDDYHKAEKELNPLIKQLLQVNCSKIVLITRIKPSFYNVVDEDENRVTKFKIEPWKYVYTKAFLESRNIEIDEAQSQEIHDVLYGHPQYLNLFCILALKSKPEELLGQIPKAREKAHSYLEKEVYNSLTSNEKALIKLIAIYRIPEEVDAFYIDDQIKDIDEELSNLTDKFLVNKIGSDKYTIHEIMRDYFLNDIKKQKTLKMQHERAADFYLKRSDDLEYILEAVFHFGQAGLKENAAKIIISNANKFISKGFWEKIEIQLKAALKNFRRKNQSQSLYISAMANYEIAELYAARYDFSEAIKYINECIFLLRKSHSSKDCFLQPYLSIACMYIVKEEKEKAMEYFDKCDLIAESMNSEEAKIVIMANRAHLLGEEEYEKRLDILMNSLEYFEQEGDYRNTASSYQEISGILQSMKSYEKAIDFGKKALSMHKEEHNYYEIAESKSKLASLYFNNPQKPVDIDSIIECLKESLNEYGKFGHIRGEADVSRLIASCYVSDDKYNFAISYSQKAKQIYHSLKQQSNESDVDLNIAFCLIKLKNYPEARSYIENSLLLDSHNIDSRLTASELYLILGNYDEAYGSAIVAIKKSESNKINRKYYLALLLAAISSSMLDKHDDFTDYLQLIGNFDISELSEDFWDFEEIDQILDNITENKSILRDAASLLKGECKYPILRFKDVEILSEIKGKEAKVFHPFTGNFTIKGTDPELASIFQNLKTQQFVDLDSPVIMGVERSKAALIIGFLTNKNIVKCDYIGQQKVALKLEDKFINI
jgi:ATP/maltotriose-dependent transcriptional regulator MalT